VLSAEVAPPRTAQLDVKRFGELFQQAVISRETDDEIVMTGSVDAAAVNSDREKPKHVHRLSGNESFIESRT
jgi:hypothetical protein